jgi:hypothetical protein
MRYARLLFVMMLAAACPLWASGEVNERRSMSPGGLVEVEMISGTIRVIGWDQNAVEITGRLTRPAEQLDIDSDGDVVSIEVNPLHGRYHDLDESLEIRMPRGARLEVETVSAPVDVTDLTGDVALSSISGNIRLKGDLRSVEVETVSGTITLEDGGDLRRGSFETVSGVIRARANFQPRGRFDFETISGTVELTVPSGMAADFEVQTFSGRIDSDFGPDPRRIDPPLPSQELIFSTGAGGARITIESFSGMVKIRQE